MGALNSVAQAWSFGKWSRPRNSKAEYSTQSRTSAQRNSNAGANALSSPSKASNRYSSTWLASFALASSSESPTAYSKCAPHNFYTIRHVLPKQHPSHTMLIVQHA